MDHEILYNSMKNGSSITFLFYEIYYSQANNCGTPFGRFESSMKFSTVFGTVLPNNPITILPASSPPIFMSKYTLKFEIKIFHKTNKVKNMVLFYIWFHILNNHTQQGS